MAISYDDWKKSYTELDAAWKQKFVDLAKNSDVGKEYMQRYASEMNATPKTTTTPTPTPTPTKTETTPTPTPTTTTAWTTSTTTPTKTGWVNVEGIKNMWDNLSYDEQQKYLGQYKWLQESLTAKGITNKTKPQEWTTTPTQTTPTKKDEWDYQDSSEWRLYEIAWHLNDYRVSQPNLFDNWDTFSNFFIDWKDRSQEQLNYLRDYFNAVKRYNSLDNMTADAVWNMLVNWAVPEDYLNYLKYSNPQRYSEVMDAKARETNKIKDSASMDTIKSMEWETDTTTSKSIEWLKSQWLFVDKDWNLIDDRREHYASEEEKKYLKQLADLAAANLDIDNTVKHTYEDLVDKYPGATKATLMAMAQDINSDLLREKENNLVEMTRLQGYVWYMQDERQEMNKAWADTIAQLEKEYWMYYQYSPEGMAELTEAQYAATNVTLDQADNGTDAQKQIALKQVLDWYYERYWEIIQRSEPQVINDVMRVAREEGISLSDALNKNFVIPLKEKPQYEALSTWQKSDWKLWQGKNWELFFYDAATQSVVPFSVDWKTWYYDTADRDERQELFKKIVDNNSSIYNIGTNIASVFRTWNIGWSCWQFGNDYSLAMIGRKIFWDDIWDKPVNSDTPTVWSCIVFDWTNSKTATDYQKQHWHVWIVTWVSNDWKTLHIVDSNLKWDWIIRQYDINTDDYKQFIKWYYDFQAESWKLQVSPWNYDLDMEKIYAEIIKNWSEWFYKGLSDEDRKSKVAMAWARSEEELYKSAWEWWNDQNLMEVTELVNSIDYMIDALDSWDVKDTKTSKFSWLNSWKTYFNKNYWDFMAHYDYVYNVLWMKQMANIKAAGTTFWSTTEWEWAKVYSTIAAMDKEKQSPKALAKALWEVKQKLIDTTKWRYVATNNELIAPSHLINESINEYSSWWSFENVFGTWSIQ